MAHDLKFKNFKIDEVIEDEGGMTIEGWGAIFGNVDSYGDVINKGAFTKTLMERKDRIAFAYMHDIYNPIGKIQVIEEQEKGLWIEVKLSAAEKGIQTKVKEGILKELSIGYREINSTDAVVEEKPVRHLNEVMLYEVSLVTLAANPLAIVTGMKAEEKRDFVNEEFERLIAIERNPQKKFELMKLKAQIEALIQQEPTEITPQIKPLTKIEILKILNS